MQFMQGVSRPLFFRCWSWTVTLSNIQGALYATFFWYIDYFRNKCYNVNIINPTYYDKGEPDSG